MGIILLIVSWMMFLFSLIDGADVPGVPDDRKLKTKISRGSGVGVIPFGYIVLVLIAFALFVFLMGLALFYKRETGIFGIYSNYLKAKKKPFNIEGSIRGKEKTLFLSTPY
ncbi:uncharacterized protein [Parasteatoda tepidariorum]|uniref:uncharacterized protein n=1 Tax=Parasteatoda tepidariorum TaxID=114398 RepID=UPI00077F9A9E|nr:uncharacterized protein LOC107448207 [Parasteatoda tepidariorum]